MIDEVAGEPSSLRAAVRRRMSRADDGEGSIVVGAKLATHEEKRRPVIDETKVRRILVVEHGQERDAVASQAGDLLDEPIQRCAVDFFATHGFEELRWLER